MAHMTVTDMCVYLQGVDAVRWSQGMQYQLEGVESCWSLTVTAAGDVVVWVQTLSGTYEAQWYEQQGRLIHTFLRPPQCGHDDLKVLAVEVGGKQQVALSSHSDQCIWLGSRDTGAWSVAWQATGEKGSEERKGQPKPCTMCQGKPGQIIAWNWHGDRRIVSVFDITQIPFCVVVPEMKLEMNACHLCYCELPGVGGALAVTDGSDGYKLCMFSLDSGALLWSVGSEDERGQQVKVAGTEWVPQGVCSDNRGRLYVADGKRVNDRIIVLSATSGSVLQVVQGRGHWEGGRKWRVSDPGIAVYGADLKYKDDEPKQGVVSGSVLQELKHPPLEEPWHLCWDEQSKSIVVGTYSTGKISYFQIAF